MHICKYILVQLCHIQDVANVITLLVTEKEIEKACEEAIRNQSCVDIFVGHLNFAGLPRSGKSSTLCRLLGKFINFIEAKIDSELPSTGVADRKQLFIQSIKKSVGFVNKGQWNEKNLVGETTFLNGIIYQSINGKIIKMQYTYCIL